METILVTGRYINKRMYILYKKDGSVFKIIREGKDFRIGNNIFIPKLKSKKRGKNTILVCRKYEINGEITEEFPLIHKKSMLWPITYTELETHYYYEHHLLLKNQLAKMRIDKKILKKVNKIDVELEVGGQLCRHFPIKWGFEYITDGIVQNITEPEFADKDHFNRYHTNCIVSTYYVRIYKATYIIYYSIGTNRNGSEHKHIRRIIITPNVDESKIVLIKLV